MTHEKDLREAPAWKLLLTMSLPVILVMLVQVLYNMADVFFLGQSGDALQVAAVALASPVFVVFSAFNTLIGFGGCTAVSIALGQGDQRKVRQYSAFVVVAALFFGVALAAGILLGLDALLPLLGANEQTAGYAAEYLRVMAVGAPFSVLGGALGNTVRADGDSKSAVIATMAGTLLNVALDPLFISLLGWGPAGAALATVLGNVVSCGALLAVTRKKPGFSLSFRDFTLKPAVSLKVLGLGLPMAAGTLLMSFSSMFSNRLLVLYGNEAVAAQGVAGKAGMLVSMVIMGVCVGVQPAVSYAYGAGDRRRLRQILRVTGVASTLVGTALAGVFLLGRGAFVAAFLEDPAVVALGRRMVVGGMVSAPLYGVYQLCGVYLQGTGKVSYATVTSLLRQGLVLLPVLYGMNALWGLDGLIYAGAVADLLSTLAGAALCLRWARQQGKGRPVAA